MSLTGVRIPCATRFSAVNHAERFLTEAFLAQDLSVEVETSSTLLLGHLAERRVSLVDPDGGLEVEFSWGVTAPPTDTWCSGRVHRANISTVLNHGQRCPTRHEDRTSN